MKKTLLAFLTIFTLSFSESQAQITGSPFVCQNGTNNYQSPFSGSYIWSVTGGATIVSQGVQTTDVIFNSTPQYTLTVITTFPTDTLNYVVTNNTPPAPTTNGSTICSGNTALPTANGLGVLGWYSAPTGGSSFFTGGMYNTPALSITTTYYVEDVVSGCASVTRSAVTITVNPVPDITINGLSTICAGNGVSLTTTLNAGGPISSYMWQPGSLATANITPTPAGTTTYTLTATNSFACTAVFNKLVTVNANPTVSVNSITICNGQSSPLTATGATTYNWAPPTGLSSTTGSSVTASPTTSTTYTVTGTTGGCSGNSVAVVTVNPLPVVTANSATVCVGASGTLTAAGALSYTWSPGGMLGSSINVSPAATTTYTVTGASAAGCFNTATATVIVNSLPTITANNQTICSGSAATLIASGGMTYIWNTGSTSSSIVVFPPFTSSYTVTGTDVNGCSNTAVGLVTVNPLPIVDAGLDQSICEYGEVSLSGSGAGIVTATWAQSGGTTEGVTINYTTLPTASTNYVFTGVDANACSGTDTVFITVTPSKHITGTITSTVGTVNANAYLLKYNAVQLVFDTFEVQAIVANQYLFSSIPFDNFLVKVVPDTALHLTLVPTYYGNEYQWDSALVINHGCLTDFTADITMIELPATSGTGFISGHIIEDDGFGNRVNGINSVMVPGGPLKGVDIKLGKNPGGGIQARTMSDSLGYYEFDNLPNDTFKIYVDIPGLPMDSSYIFTIASGTEVFTDLDFYADSNSVNPLFVAVGLQNVKPKAETFVNVFPNPAKQNVKIQFHSQTGNSKIELMNMQGLTLFEKNLSGLPKGKHELQLNLEQMNLSSGIYFIKISTDNSMLTEKLIITE